MKPSSDIALFTTTLPFPVLVALISSTAILARPTDESGRSL